MATTQSVAVFASQGRSAASGGQCLRFAQKIPSSARREWVCGPAVVLGSRHQRAVRILLLSSRPGRGGRSLRAQTAGLWCGSPGESLLRHSDVPASARAALRGVLRARWGRDATHWEPRPGPASILDSPQMLGTLA